MQITALAPWFGSKRTLAPEIIRQLGPHAAYFEPFCGSMAVLLAKPESSHETVNDLHGHLINLARILANEDQAVRLYGRLARVLCDEQRRGESLAAMQTAEDPEERAFHYFLVSWLGRNGFCGIEGADRGTRASFAVRWTPGGGHGGGRFVSAVESIPAWHQRLRHATILNRDGFEVLEKIDDHPDIAVYVDPPYLAKSDRYTHDFEDADHARLAGLLARFHRARVVVSYYADPRLADLYPGWACVDCATAKGLHNAGRRGAKAKEAPEILIVNGNPYGEPSLW